ncbi:SMP-30/gluconolactonase/LRE family protein [Solirubrobacter ginsenosidimutans]|uniref:SMP-30/gluconolactonase/LRE family protein n=1 Tax=Solirubrobacter ginsenosidimutans TaxID=490573 RepID=A0A9X3S5A6_9ACTN|nr:SMP-30/gluconolactonase/LRE family protein [Solirubrobacter ginsenosidimutans]MDA0163966.1 SMP-30/gluconolactonase/LRE family protein [Solirubrobacter ginsenosidimutans]
MGARELRTLCEGGSYFEGPRWHDGRWWVSDFYRHGVFALDPDGREELVLEVAGQPSGLGWMPDGSLLVVSMLDHTLLRRAPDGTVTVHADLTEHCGGHLNDMTVDELGRAYVGNFGFDLMTFADPAGTGLVRVDPDGSAHVVADDLWFPNGTVLDGDTLIVAETFAGRLTAFSIAADGALGDRRVWGQIAPTVTPGTIEEMLPNLGFAPDGCCMDAEGHIWAADGLGGPPCRIAPGGEIVDELPLPDGLGAFACMLGGEDGRTLLLCAAPDFIEANRKDTREAVLLTTTVDVPHGGRP